jgi:hypothetical protein
MAERKQKREIKSRREKKARNEFGGEKKERE